MAIPSVEDSDVGWIRIGVSILILLYGSYTQIKQSNWSYCYKLVLTNYNKSLTALFGG